MPGGPIVSELPQAGGVPGDSGVSPTWHRGVPAVWAQGGPEGGSGQATQHVGQWLQAQEPES